MPVDIARNFRDVTEHVRRAAERVNRDPDGIIIVGAAKSVDCERIQQALEAGLRHVGENYVQEGVEKIAELPSTVTWHFIGHLQTNKVKRLLGRFEWIHSIDRLPLIDELNKRAKSTGIIAKVLIEVNLAGESTKTGASVEELRSGALLSAAMEAVPIVGLMTMPPPADDPQQSRPYFQQLRELRDELQSRFGHELPHLSMGMTADYEVAIEEGATMVRIGTGIFGPRKR